MENTPFFSAYACFTELAILRGSEVEIEEDFHYKIDLDLYHFKIAESLKEAIRQTFEAST